MNILPLFPVVRTAQVLKLFLVENATLELKVTR